ncbi:MAG: hypothetical protein IPG53_23520 [Ignavibacteriales bacterium]|nr:hypothetical protein [Ignavibacteriales bacterium]
MIIKLLLLTGLMFTGNLFSQGVERIDWGYYFSNALYTKWSPVGTPVPGTPSLSWIKKNSLANLLVQQLQPVSILPTPAQFLSMVQTIHNIKNMFTQLNIVRTKG